ncbi:hypothetical protein [Spiroplasma endosymbiont of Dactylopius coccus]
MRHKCSDWTYERVFGCEMCYRVANEMERIRKENKKNQGGK